MNYRFDFSFLADAWPRLLHGAWLTVQLATASIVVGFVLGALCAVLRSSGPPWVRRLIGGYVEAIRNTPLLVQIFLLYFGLSTLGVKITAETSALLTLTINIGAYSTEIIRAGIQTVARSQIEAGQCLGLNRAQVYWHVVLLPAVERAKVVAFSAPYSVNQLVIGATKDVAITGMKDLVGRRVAVARGNLQDLELTKSAPQGTQLVRYEDDATANTALIAGQVDAIATPSTTVKTLATRHPAKNFEIKFVVAVQPLAIGLRKEDTELHAWINSWVEKSAANGHLNEIYSKWMGLQLPDMSKLAVEARAIAS